MYLTVINRTGPYEVSRGPSSDNEDLAVRGILKCIHRAHRFMNIEGARGTIAGKAFGFIINWDWKKKDERVLRVQEKRGKEEGKRRRRTRSVW